MGIWLLAAVPFGMSYLQAMVDVRTYEADPACTSGISAPPSDSGGCGVGTVTVGSAHVRAGRYDLSLKFPDGARREVAVSERTYRLFSAPGTLTFVQMRRSRITLIGDERHVERTPNHPVRRLAGTRAPALAAFGSALAVSFAAALSARRDVRLRRANRVA